MLLFNSEYSNLLQYTLFYSCILHFTPEYSILLHYTLFYSRILHFTPFILRLTLAYFLLSCIFHLSITSFYSRILYLISNIHGLHIMNHIIISINLLIRLFLGKRILDSIELECKVGYIIICTLYKQANENYYFILDLFKGFL